LCSGEFIHQAHPSSASPLVSEDFLPKSHGSEGKRESFLGQVVQKEFLASFLGSTGSLGDSSGKTTFRSDFFIHTPLD
jgi:hypothetical protein